MTSLLASPPAASRRASKSLAAALLVATALGTLTLAPPSLAPVAPAFARSAPESFADLAERVFPAVVNISASSTVAANPQRTVPLPQVPPGSPLEDLFEEFFNRRGGEGQRGPQPRTPQQQRRSNSLGSGFVIDATGIVVTNAHVIGDATDVSVILGDGTRLKATILGKDTKVDLAVLKVTPDAGKPLTAVKFGNSDAVRVGDWVMAIGNPFGLGGSVTAGILSARNRNIQSGPYDSYLQTDAAINRGNSGGPLFNMAGEVIGINTAILSPSGGSIGIGFSVPSNLATGIIDQLREFGETRRGWLGVRIQNVDDTIAESLGLGATRGALIAGVDEKGPAKPAGLEPGDVIIRFDGKPVKDSQELPRVVASSPVGREVEVVIVRKGREIVRKVTLARLEDNERQASVQSQRPPNGEADRPATQSRAVIGMELTPLTDDLRRRNNYREGLKGVVVTRVDPSSAAADKGVQANDVIVEVQQEPVARPEDVQKRVEDLKRQGRKSALFLVQAARGGDPRFVAINIE